MVWATGVSEYPTFVSWALDKNLIIVQSQCKLRRLVPERNRKHARKKFCCSLKNFFFLAFNLLEVNSDRGDVGNFANRNFVIRTFCFCFVSGLKKNTRGPISIKTFLNGMGGMNVWKLSIFVGQWLTVFDFFPNLKSNSQLSSASSVCHYF